MILRLPNTYRVFYGAFHHLHPIQQRAVEAVLAQKDLILQSATGSGKTEAVLPPCTERVIRSGANESVLYIVPTRALAASWMICTVNGGITRFCSLPTAEGDVIKFSGC